MEEGAVVVVSTTSDYAEYLTYVDQYARTQQSAIVFGTILEGTKVYFGHKTGLWGWKRALLTDIRRYLYRLGILFKEQDNKITSLNRRPLIEFEVVTMPTYGYGIVYVHNHMEDYGISVNEICGLILGTTKAHIKEEQDASF